MVDAAFVVAVPEAAREAAPTVRAEQDERFAEQHDDALRFDAPDDIFADVPMPSVPPAPAVDVEQIRADARALIDAAQADAEALLQRAAQQAKALVEGAVARAGQIEEAARAKGQEEGTAAGHAAIEAELADDVAAIHELIASVRAQRHQVIESAEPELVNLAMAVAERVVHEHLAVSPTAVLENVRSALTRLVGREVVTLRVNPADLEIIRQQREALASGNDVEHLRVVEDQRVDRGGVVVETDAGTVDAKVATQLREARRALQNADGASIAPAQAS